MHGTPAVIRPADMVVSHAAVPTRAVDQPNALLGHHNIVTPIGCAVFHCCRPRHAATVLDPSSGLQLQLLTTAPAVQFYTGGFLGGSLPDTKEQCPYPKFGGFCLETQNFPDAVNQPTFPSPILQPGQEYKQEIIYKFSVPIS